MTDDLNRFTERYLEMWNEPNADLRAKTIRELWAPDGANYTLTMAAVGYDELEKRVTSAYDSYVGTGQYRFGLNVPPVAHHDAVKVQWEMVNTATDEVASIGLEFLIRDADGRITSDHQFLVS
jgi:hypothetical protein